MRKTLFALFLVLAAFAGGAVVNGPGLAWLKTSVFAAIQDRLKPAGTIVKSPPDAPKQPLQLSDLPDGLRPPGASDRPNLIDGSTAGTLGSISLNDPAMPSSTIEVTAPPPKSDAQPVELTRPDPAPTPVAPMTAPAFDPVVTPVSIPSPSPEWADLRRRMRELGVSRYEIDGEPGGRSRFRCLIPLVGRRAVGQQFEGEGDDDFQAADAALRRVALWRATEMAPQ